MELSPHTDYQLKATIQMSSLQQAISAVSGLHRYKIGGKRIQVSLITGGSNKTLAMLRYGCAYLSYFSNLMNITVISCLNCLTGRVCGMFRIQ